MANRILITGGAGFIGSHVVDQLLVQGYEVRVIDKLVAQVHGDQGPAHLSPEAEFIRADVLDIGELERSLAGVDAVIHLAAEVGVGQSMYEIKRYVDANSGGTAALLDLLANTSHRVKKLVVASSMSAYGEGSYECTSCGRMAPPLRSGEQMARGEWEVRCPACGSQLAPIPTAEDKPLQPTSVYAVSKLDQELLCHAFGAAYGLPTVALRFFNAYGPRQALSNPYTGVAAVFCSQLLNGRRPMVFEDGQQRRDLIHVSDVARSLVAALETDGVAGESFNIGSGSPVTINEVGQTLADALDRSDLTPDVTHRHRAGDIRHCWADTSKAQKLLGFQATTTFADGVSDLIEWVVRQQADDVIDLASGELQRRGLAR